jgi:2-polyprenyl-3-methyl-5-hydroxy-6-metoxy-1,4-benzoquinol methylase
MQVIAQNISFGSIEPNSYDCIYTKKKNYNGEKPDKKIIKTTRKHCQKKADIADIGAGDGRNTIPLAKLGHNVDAFEISPVGRDIIKTKAINLPNVNISPLNIVDHQPTKTYDEIFMSHISQHFNTEDMGKIFANISNALKKAAFLSLML